VKIVGIHTLISCGAYAHSTHWAVARAQIHSAIKSCCWPPGSKKFTIYPQSGKKRDEGNGVGPIKNEFVRALKTRGWAIEGRAKNMLGHALGDFDAVMPGPEKPIVAEWETGNISSSHRSMNKLTMLVSDGIISAVTLVVPSRKLYVYLTDRIGNIRELEPYFRL
jgi:Restriction endonuclease BamHI